MAPLEPMGRPNTSTQGWAEPVGVDAATSSSEVFGWAKRMRPMRSNC